MVFTALFCTFHVAPAASQAGEFVSAVGDLVAGVLSVPVGVLAGTVNGPPIIGTVGGALQGAASTVGYTLRGALRLIGVAIPAAASVAPYIPVFL